MRIVLPLLLLSLCSGESVDGGYRLSLKSRKMAVTVIPLQYMGGKESPVVKLADSGILETEINLGQPARSVNMLYDCAGRETFIPAALTSKGTSYSMVITHRGTWRDMLNVGGLKVEQEFQFYDEEVGRLGLNVDQTGLALFNNIVNKRMLGMQIFSTLLTRVNGQLMGELRIGELERSLRGAQLRYNQVLLDELGWSLRVFDVRMGQEYLGYKGRVVIDTMTPYVVVPVVIFTAIAQLLKMPIILDKDVYMTKPVHCKGLRKLPPLHFAIETDEFVWDSAHYILSTDDGQCRLALAGFDTQVDGMPVWIFGTSFFVDRATVFDLQTGHIGLTDYEADVHQDEVVMLVKDAL